MSKEYCARSFRSGNSVAIRLPAALGVEAGREWIVVEENGDLIFRPNVKPKPKRKFNVDEVWGIGKDLDLQLIKPEDRIFEERELDWEGKQLSRG